jgi:hypothetical protein
MTIKNPNSFARINLIAKVKGLLLMEQTTQVKKTFTKVNNLSKSLHIKYVKIWGALMD